MSIDLSLDYLKSIDFNHWEKKVHYPISRILRLKRDASKAPYIMESYSTYLQLLEIFFINYLALRERGSYFQSLFIKNDRLRLDIEECFLNEGFIDWMLDNYVFGIESKETIREYKKIRQIHASIIKECTKDYLKDYELLNAYKHGYRARVSHGKRVIAINSFPIVQGDSEIVYFSRRGKDIFKNTLIFNHKRIYIKQCFIIEMLKNAQKVFLAVEHPTREVNLNHYHFTDESVWKGTFGGARFREKI